MSFPSFQFKPLTRRLMGVLALGLGLSLGAQAQTALPPGYKAEYKLSTVVGTAFPWGKGGEIWANMVRERKAKRWNGYTDGKGTADRVVDRIERAAPKLIDDAVKKALRKHFD